MTHEIQNLKTTLHNGLVSYMEFGAADDKHDPDYDPDFDAGYTQDHIDQCMGLLDTFLVTLKNVPPEGKTEFIMAAVKNLVLGLNAANESCDGAMIETDQREQLCEIIITAAKEAGLESDEDDITEEWREW